MSELPPDDGPAPDEVVLRAAPIPRVHAAAGFDAEVEREIRLSVVLYGGVSLAIYMNGVCQELLNLVRATSGEAVRNPTHAQTTLHAQYRAAAAVSPQDIERGYAGFDDVDHVETLTNRPIRRRVVVDVLSGSSAGGLNALFLSRALITDGDLSAIAELFVEQADFERLLNDERRAEHLPWTPGERLADLRETGAPPTSLLSGDRFYQLLLDALSEPDEPGQPLVSALDCFMTMTDLRGVPTRDVALAEGQEVRELQHRTVAHLRYGQPESYGARRNDFFGRHGETGSPIAPFLAFIGRATAAHPAAFHPAQLTADSHLVVDPAFTPTDRRWASLLTPGYSPEQLAQRWFSDGGDLDNKPFTHAIDPVEERTSSIPVDRRIVYVEPDPDPPSERWAEPTPPGLSEFTVGAYTLPRREGIVDDLERIERRNDRARSLRRTLHDAIRLQPQTAPLQRGNWAQGRPRSPERLLYEIERARSVVDTLAAWADGVLSTSEQGAALEAAANASAQTRAAVVEALGADADRLVEDHEHRRQLLVDHDIDYRFRRLSFLDRLLDEHQTKRPDRMTAAPGADPVTDATFDDARALRAALNVQALRLLALERRLALRDRFESESLADGVDVGPLREALAVHTRAGADVDLVATVGTLLDARATIADAVLDSVSAETRAALADHPRIVAMIRLQPMYDGFDGVDVHLLPRFAATTGEVDPIEVSRFSPVDTTVMTPPRPGRPMRTRLGGAAVGHFGAFFDTRWRHNDILWGRLDAAELIVRMLLPRVADEPAAVEDLRLRLITRAQVEIIASEPAAIDAVGELIGDPRCRKETAPGELHLILTRAPDLDLRLATDRQRRDTKMALLQRAPRIAGQVIAGARRVPATGASVDEAGQAEETMLRADRTGRLVNSLAQLAIPRSDIPRLVRVALLPMLVIGSLASLYASCPDGARRWILWPIGGLLVLAAGAVAARRVGAKSAGREVAATALRVLGVGLAAAGFVVPLTRASLPVEARAWIYAFLGMVLAVVYAALAFGRLLSSGPWRSAIVRACGLAALASLIGAMITDWRTAMIVVAALVLMAVSAGCFVGLSRLERSLNQLGEPARRRASAVAGP